MITWKDGDIISLTRRQMQVPNVGMFDCRSGKNVDSALVLQSQCMRQPQAGRRDLCYGKIAHSCCQLGYCELLIRNPNHKPGRLFVITGETQPCLISIWDLQAHLLHTLLLSSILSPYSGCIHCAINDICLGNSQSIDIRVSPKTTA